MSFFDAPDIFGGRALKGLTTFGIGGPAEYLALPSSEKRAAEIIARARSEGIKVRLLGGGSKLLVSDGGVKGLVVKLPAERARLSGGRAAFSAGTPLVRAIDVCMRAGLSGLEELAGIPGTVGGAAVMNAGAFGRELGQLVARVGVLEGGRVEEMSKDSCLFAYRSSALRDRIVLWVELELREAAPSRISRRMDGILAERRRKFPPGRSAGCVFKNGRLRAGALIEALGLKGARLGRARVSPRHANFIVNLDGATADDVLGLVKMIRAKALAEAGLVLELEVEVWNG